MTPSRPLFREQAVGAAVPYLAVGIGLYLLHSAWASILLYHAGILACLAAGRRLSSWRGLLAGLNGPGLAVAGTVCALAGPAAYLLWPWIHVPEYPLRDWLARYGLEGWSWITLLVYFSTVHPVLEEMHWRTLSSAAARPSWMDAAFAGYHVLVLLLLLKGAWLLLVWAVLAAASWCWCRMAARFGGWAVPLLTHALADASVILAACALAAAG